MALREYVVHNVSPASLGDLLQSEVWPWLYAERMEATELMFLADALEADVPWQRWQHGRAFGSESELAWWRQPDERYQVRLLAEGALPAGLAWGEAVAQWTPWSDKAEATLLHGTLDGETGDRPSWSEARIPRWLHYPVTEQPAPERVVLLTLVYQRNGIPGLTRLVGVQGAGER
jgi:hypothetical protein